MKSKLCFVFLILATALIGAGTKFPHVEEHCRLLREGLDVAFWRQNWTDDSWRIKCFFIDMPPELRLVFGCMAGDEDRYGDSWWVWRIENGKFCQMKQIGDVYFNCHRHSFYLLSFKDDWKVVLGLHMMSAGYYDAERRHIVKRTPDCTFHFTHDGKYYLRPITPDFDTVFKGDGVKSVERLCAEWYFGFDFKPLEPVPHDPRALWQPYRLPRGDLRPGGGVGEPSGFKAFLPKYREEVRMRLELGSKKIKVLAVFLDADNDGEADCYVANDAERRPDGAFPWTLYLTRKGALSAATSSVAPVPGHEDIPTLPPTTRAGASSFCRVLCYRANPYFVIQDDKAPKNLVHYQLFLFDTQRVEKLDCREYAE